MIYRFVFLCLFIRTVLCATPPKIELLPNHVSPEVCGDIVLLGGNFQSATFKLTFNRKNDKFVVGKFFSTGHRHGKNNFVCDSISIMDVCPFSLGYEHYKCECEQKGPGEYHLTFINSPTIPRKAFTVHMNVSGYYADSMKIFQVKSDSFTFKEVRGPRDCWTPTMKILNTKTSFSCSDDYVLLNIDYHLIKFNISWSNSDYVLDRTGTPTVVDSSSEADLCPLIDQNNNCSFRMYEGYSCLCNMITPDEYHLTFKYTPTRANRSLTLYMKWVSKNGAAVIKSDNHTFQESTDMCELEKNWATTLTGAGIVFGILIISAIGGIL